MTTQDTTETRGARRQYKKRSASERAAEPFLKSIALAEKAGSPPEVIASLRAAMEAAQAAAEAGTLGRVSVTADSLLDELESELKSLNSQRSKHETRQRRLEAFQIEIGLYEKNAPSRDERIAWLESQIERRKNGQEIEDRPEFEPMINIDQAWKRYQDEQKAARKAAKSQNENTDSESDTDQNESEVSDS